MIASAVFVSAAIAAPVANAAGLQLADPATCADNGPVYNPFAQFGDTSNYFLVRGSSFERDELNSDKWNGRGGAQIAYGSETYAVSGDADARSMSLSSGASATSPEICVGKNEPTMRWFSRQSSGTNGQLLVDVLYTDDTGQSQVYTAGASVAGTAWAPSTIVEILPALQTLADGQKTKLRFRFRATNGDWRFDDVFVDPYARW